MYWGEQNWKQHGWQPILMRVGRTYMGKKMIRKEGRREDNRLRRANSMDSYHMKISKYLHKLYFHLVLLNKTIKFLNDYYKIMKFWFENFEKCILVHLKVKIFLNQNRQNNVRYVYYSCIWYSQWRIRMFILQ